MQQVFIVLFFAVVIAHSANSSSRLSFSIPKEDLLQDSYETDSLSQPISPDKDSHPLESPEGAEKLRTALRALLRLNDGELESIMKGIPVEDLKETLSPSTAFILQASKSRFERIKALISDREKNQKLLGDMQIARRNKNQGQALRSETLEERDFEATGDSDSLFGALADLSESIQKNRRSKKSQKKHKRHSFHSSSSARKVHYSYWMKPDECVKNSEGFPQVHCPHPTETGQWICVDDQELCDGFSHCPEHEDEDPMACLYFKTMQNYVDDLISQLLLSKRS